MDAQLLLEFSEALKEEQRLDRMMLGATGDESRELSRLLNGVRRSVGMLQNALLSTYNVDYVECRDVGHVWQVRDRNVIDNSLLRVLVCPRCKSERHESFSRYGELDGRRYVSNAEYRMPKGVEAGDRPRLTKSFWRGVAFMQATRA